MTDRLTEIADQAFTFLLDAASMQDVDQMLWRLNGASNNIECDSLAICNLRRIDSADLLYGLDKD